MLTHLESVLIAYKPKNDAVKERRVVKQAGCYGQKVIEPSSRLVDCFAYKIGGEATLKRFLIFKWIVPLCKGHGTRIEPAIYYNRFSAHGLSALLAGECYRIKEGLVAVKSTIWLRTFSTLLDKIESRRKGGHCKFIVGNYEEFKEIIRKKEKPIRSIIYIVQPSISKSKEMPEKIQEVLAATQYYINNSGRVKGLKILGSE